MQSLDVPVAGVYDVTIGLEGGGHCLRPLLYAVRKSTMRLGALRLFRRYLDNGHALPAVPFGNRSTATQNGLYIWNLLKHIHCIWRD